MFVLLVFFASSWNQVCVLHEDGSGVLMIYWFQLINDLLVSINHECQDICRGVQFLGDSLSGQLNFVFWHLIFVGP
jgi:hypothetical protein